MLRFWSSLVAGVKGAKTVLSFPCTLRYGHLRSSPEEGVAMMSNCSLYPLEPLDPAVDPAYADGPPPPEHRVNHAGEIEIDWPVSFIPSRLSRYRTISFETLEDELERNAEREEHPG
jgi:hypothetical protein